MPYKNIEERRACDKRRYERDKEKRRAAQDARDKSPEGRKKRNASARRRRKENPEHFKALDKVFNARSSEKRADALLKKKYGISLSHKQSLLEDQGFKCAICQEGDDTIPLKNWHVDHDHSRDTPHHRGILCCRCNIGFGYFKENVEILKNAIEYALYWHRAGS